ncbi:MAG: sigma 54-interacting transcriptional regulator [Pyrinomonadaceae bacterium]
MLERMIGDALRAGENHETLEHAVEVEKIVGQELLPTEQALRLMLLTARLLDAASAAENDEYGRKCSLFVARMVPFCESLQQSQVKWASERFAARLQLNRGDVARARTLANRIERRITRLAGGAGRQLIEIPEAGDEGLVSADTWLLLAEVALCERNFAEAGRALEAARTKWGGEYVCAEDAALFELLTALRGVGAGEGEGLAALAYLYSKHHARGATTLDVQMLSRIAAAAGYDERVRGIGALEAERWRRLGPPERAMVESFVGGVTPSGQARGLGLEGSGGGAFTGTAAVTGEGEAAGGETLKVVRMPERQEFFPLDFDLTRFRLDSITGLFDVDRMTGPLVIDWSGCERALLEEAVRDGAIFDGVLVSDSGTIFFNEGAYADAVFDTDDGGLRSLTPFEVLVELHRIGMARLPKSRGCQTACGPEECRTPARVDARPNHLNIDILRRIDVINARRRGETIPPEEEAGDLLAEWDLLAAGAQRQAAYIPAEVLDPLSRLMAAESLTDVCLAVSGATSSMACCEVRAEVTGEDESSALAAAGAKPDDGLSWSVLGAGSLKLRVGLSNALALSQEGVRFVLEAAVHRLRLMPGARTRPTPFIVPDFIAVDSKTLQMLEEVRIFARMDGTTDDKSRALRHILISGERGTGKEEIARLVHKLSGRSSNKYVTADSGVLNNPDQLAAELFGARDGAYTGMKGDRKGLVQEAEGGSLFFDEIDEGVTVQSMLKRFAQFRTYKTLGAADAGAADVRLIIATNRISGGEALIKEDLRDRFWEVRVPPLRERRADIRPLAEFFAQDIRGYALPASVLGWLETLDWPGNVRQLRNTVERACSLADDPARELTLELFEDCVERNGGKRLIRVEAEAGGFEPLRAGETLKDRLLQYEREHILAALKATSNNKARAATLLGLASRQSLYPRLVACGISEEDIASPA